MAVINTNVKALFSQMALNSSGRAQATAMQQLSTGKRINSARDDAAGMAIATRMTHQIRSLNQAVRNAGDAISLIQTAEGATNEITDMMQRMRELAIQAVNDTNDPQQRGYLDLEFQQLKQQIVQIADNTEWNGFPVLNGKAGEQVGEMPVYKATSNSQFGDVLLNPTTTRVIEGTASGEQQTIAFSTSAIPVGTGGVAQTNTVNFPSVMAVGDTVTVGGLTFTCKTTAISSASTVAAAFASKAAGYKGTGAEAGIGGVFTGTLTGWASTTNVSGAVVFTRDKNYDGTDNLSVSSNGAATPTITSPTLTTQATNAGFAGTRTFKFADQTINLQWDAIKNLTGQAVNPTKLLAQIQQQLNTTNQWGSGSGRSVTILNSGAYTTDTQPTLVVTYAAKDGDVPSVVLSDASNDGFFCNQ